MRSASFIKLLFLVACGAASASALQAQDIIRNDIVLKWNAYLREAMKRDSDHVSPGYASRSMAMMNGAIYDCFQAIRRTHQPFRVNLTASPTASRNAAVAEASYRIATALYPTENFFLYWGYRYSIDAIEDGADKTAGLALGQAVATAYLSWRQTDGFDTLAEFDPGTGPGKWRPETGFVPMEKKWAAIAPFLLTNAQQFQRPSAPLLTSAAYTAAFNEVKSYGDAGSEVRTQDQFQVARFWAYDRSGVGPPPVLYNRNLEEICQQRGTSAEANARLFAVASVAMADAAVCAWAGKAVDQFWRPMAAIHEADTDGNPDTVADPDWTPYGVPGGNFPNFTPPSPSYVSGHASMGEATYQSVKRFFGIDQAAFSLTSDEVPGATRYYASFSQAAQENADSRVWLGVNWRFDQTEGQILGTDVANYIADNAFQPVLETYADFAGVYGTSADGAGDKDKDGAVDFAADAFGTHPLKSDTPPGAVVETMGGIPCVVMRYTCAPSRSAAGLALVAQRSADLSAWTAVGLTDEIDPDRTSTVSMQCRRAYAPIVPGSALFLRLKAQM